MARPRRPRPRAAGPGSSALRRESPSRPGGSHQPGWAVPRTPRRPPESTDRASAAMARPTRKSRGCIRLSKVAGPQRRSGSRDCPAIQSIVIRPAASESTAPRPASEAAASPASRALPPTSVPRIEPGPVSSAKGLPASRRRGQASLEPAAMPAAPRPRRSRPARSVPGGSCDASRPRSPWLGGDGDGPAAEVRSAAGRAGHGFPGGSDPGSRRSPVPSGGRCRPNPSPGGAGPPRPGPGGMGVSARESGRRPPGGRGKPRIIRLRSDGKSGERGPRYASGRTEPSSTHAGERGVDPAGLTARRRRPRCGSALAPAPGGRSPAAPGAGRCGRARG